MLGSVVIGCHPSARHGASPANPPANAPPPPANPPANAPPPPANTPPPHPVPANDPSSAGPMPFAANAAAPGYMQYSGELDRLMRGMARGDVPLDRYIDSARGVVFARNLENGEPPGRQAQLLCGGALHTWFRHHRSQMRMAFVTLDESGPGDWSVPLLTCRDDHCTYTGVTEGDSATELHYVRRHGRLVLDSVIELDCCTTSEGWDSAGAALGARPGPAPRSAPAPLCRRPRGPPLIPRRAHPCSSRVPIGYPSLVPHRAAFRLVPSLLLLLAACSGSKTAPLTQLVVVVDSDLAVPSALDTVHLLVTAPDGSAYDKTVQLTGPGAIPLPLTLGVQYTSGTLEPVMITATGRHAGSAVVTTQVNTAWVLGESRLVHIVLSATCVGVPCQMGMTCREGVCLTSLVPGSTLPVFDGSIPGLDGSVQGLDGGMDAAIEGGTDAGMDAAVDGGIDAPVDGSSDGPVDAASDSGPVGCVTELGCPTGTRCEHLGAGGGWAGVCQTTGSAALGASCGANADCMSGRCYHTYCHAPCKAMSQCPSGSCTAESDEGYVCVAAVCSSDCDAGEACADVCVTTCDAEGDCPAGQACVLDNASGRGPVCTTGTQSCGSTEIELVGVAAHPCILDQGCSSGADCPPSYTCVTDLLGPGRSLCAK